MRRHIELFQLLGRTDSFSRWSIDFQTITAGLSPEVELSEAIEGVLDCQPAVGHLNRQQPAARSLITY
jgi:hypothetical protein